MDMKHGARCVTAAIAAGGKVIDNPTARWILQSRLGRKVQERNIIRDGPFRPVWGGDNNFYIAYWDGGEIMEVKSGSWVKAVEEEDRKLSQENRP